VRLEDFCAGLEGMPFPNAAETATPDRESVLQVRAALAAAVADDEFLAGCMLPELELVERTARPRRGLPPFLTLPRTGIRLALAYWPPGGSIGAHEHTAWTVTTVCRNQLQVVTFDRAESYRRRSLVPKNCFDAPAGRVGYIYEPCIHEPKNPSGEWSLSLHIVSPQDGKPAADQPEPLPGLGRADGSPPAQVTYPPAYAALLLARQRMALIEQLSRILAPMKVALAAEALGKCYGLGSTATQQFIEHAAPHAVRERERARQWHLAKVHGDLMLSHQSGEQGTSLMVETPNGRRETLTVNAVARDAIVYATENDLFDVRALPGRMNEEERLALAMALEGTGVFRRVAP